VTADARVIPVNRQDPAPAVVAEAAEVLWEGALIIYPTDTLYALGGRAWDDDAARRVIALKGREGGKGLPLIATDLDQVRSLCGEWPAAATVLAERFWPGPLSLVLPARPEVPEDLAGPGRTVAVRVPACKCARSLCALAGPLIATSANPSGQPPAAGCTEAVRLLGQGVALALDGGPSGAIASTLVDLGGAAPRLLRPGAVEWEQINDALRVLRRS
jgi:L-threonylcarbamoyladenylate synthase